MCRKAPWRSKRRGHHPITCDVKGIPQTSGPESILEKSSAHMLGRLLEQFRCGKRNQIIGLKVNKDPEELSCARFSNTDTKIGRTVLYKRQLPLFCAPPHEGGCPHPSSRSVHLCLASVLTKQFFCALSHLLLCFVSSKLCTCIYIFGSMRNAFCTGGRGQGKIASSL